MFVKATSDAPDYICLLTDLFENVYTRDMEAKVVWFLRPQEVQEALAKMRRKWRRPENKCEIFFSDINSRISVQSITGCTNVCVKGEEEIEGGEFTCSWLFSNKDGHFIPVSCSDLTSCLYPFNPNSGRSRRLRQTNLSSSSPTCLKSSFKTPQPSQRKTRLATECHSEPAKTRLSKLKTPLLVTTKQTYCSPKPSKKPRVTIPLKRVSNRHYSEMTPEQPTCSSKERKSKERARRSLSLSAQTVVDLVNKDSDLLLGSEEEEEEEEDYLPSEEESTSHQDDEEMEGEEEEEEEEDPLLAIHEIRKNRSEEKDGGDHEEEEEEEEEMQEHRTRKKRSITSSNPRSRGRPRKDLSLSLPTKKSMSTRKENSLESARTRSVNEYVKSPKIFFAIIKIITLGYKLLEAKQTTFISYIHVHAVQIIHVNKTFK